jgi:hypothetical protein
MLKGLTLDIDLRTGGEEEARAGSSLSTSSSSLPFLGDIMWLGRGSNVGRGSNDGHNETKTHLDRLHAVSKEMGTIIRRNGGYRCQFHVDDKGTILIAVFGVFPYSHEDDANRCVNSSLEMRTALQKMKVDATIGVATGDIYAGAVGSNNRRQYTVMGDTVNLSARCVPSFLSSPFYL